MSADAQVESGVEDWMAAHLPRAARVDQPPGWPWPGGPHPSCRKAEVRLPPEGRPDAPVEEWSLLRAALAHDRHVLATGQVCPGSAGTVAATPRPVHEDRLRGAVAALGQARQRLLQAQRDVAHHEREIARARALIDVARRLEGDDA